MTSTADSRAVGVAGEGSRHHLISGTGTCLRGWLRVARLAGRVVGFPDSLSVGPAPAGLEIEELIEARHAFWKVVLGRAPSGPRGLRGDLAAAIEGNDVTLWLGTGSDDQLMAAWVCAMMRAVHAPPRVRVVQFTTVPRRRGRPFHVRSADWLAHDQLGGTESVVLRARETRALATAWAGIDPVQGRYLCA
jgi:hypothetical protein